MHKALKYLLVFSLFLMGEAVYVHAHNSQTCVNADNYSSQDDTIALDQKDQGTEMMSISSSASAEDHNFDGILAIEFEEEEEDKLVTSFRYLDVNHYSVVICSELTDQHFFTNDYTELSFWKQFSNTTSFRCYLMLEVFRL